MVTSMGMVFTRRKGVRDAVLGRRKRRQQREREREGEEIQIDRERNKADGRLEELHYASKSG